MAGCLGGAGRARRSRRKLEKRVSAGRIRRGDGTGRATGLRDLKYLPTIQLATVSGGIFPTISISAMAVNNGFSSYLVGGQRRYRQDHTLVSGLPVEHAGCR